MASIETPACPRCGYDLGGMIDSWRMHSPLQATCSECGLTFECADVLSPTRAAPLWFFESGRRSFARFIGTLVRSLQPVRFWRQVRLEYALDGRRLVLAALIVLLAVHGAAIGLALLEVYTVYHEALVWRQMQIVGGNFVVAIRPTWTEVLWHGRGDLPMALVWPYGLQAGWRSRPPIGGLGFELIAAFMLAMPLSFLVLGDTMRQARVRPLHLLRGFAWSLAAPAVLVMGGAVAAWLLRAEWISLATKAAAIVWLGIYWHYFTWRYLRLPHAWGVTIAMVLISVLTGAIVQVGVYLLRFRAY